MKENETIAEMVTRFTDIINSLVALVKDYTQVEKIRKVSCTHIRLGEENYYNRRSK